MATQVPPYPSDQPVALFEGQCQSTADRTISTSTSDTDEIPFGRAVVRDTAGASDKSVKLPSGSGDVFVGITLYQQNHVDNTDTNGEQAWQVDVEFPTLYIGQVWVKPEETVAPEDPVFFRHTSGGGGSVLGKFRKDADTASATQAKNARYVTGGTSSDFVLIEFTQTGNA